MIKICNKSIYYLGCILLCLACAKQPKDAIIQPDLLGEATDTLYFSRFVNNLEYIPLETSDSCLIGQITDIRIVGEQIFVLDRHLQTVWIFNKQGKYIRKIFRQGNGPEEYAHIGQFDVDAKKQQLALLDIQTNKLLLYDFEGNFRGKVALELPASDFKFSPSGGFVLSLAGRDDGTAGIYYADDTGKTVRQLVKRNEHSAIYMNTDWELCSFGGEISFMSPIFENNVYHFDGKTLSTSYAFDMMPPLKNHYGKNDSFQHMEDFVRTIFIESDEWIYATYWSAVHSVRHFIYSKKENRYWISRFLENDMDPIEYDGKTSETQNNCFTYWYLPENNADGNPILQILHLK